MIGENDMNKNKLSDIAFGLGMGIFAAFGLMFILMILWVCFMLVWEGAGLIWALAYLVGLLIGGGVGVKDFT